MPKFGTVYFNEDYFGTGRLNQVFRKKSIKHIPLGLTVRGTVGRDHGDTSNAVTFRSRHGNGHYGSKLGHIYQDKFKYCVPDPNADNCGNAPKTCFANAVAAWQALTDTQKKVLITKANKHYKIPAYNLFISKYMKENYS